MLNSIKITYIHQDGLLTGSAISLLNMIRSFPSGAISADVIFMKNGPVIQIFENEGIKTHVCKSNGFWTTPGPKWYQLGNLENIKALIPNLKLRRLIKSLQPNIIHINDKAALNAGISTMGTSIPVVQHLRSTFYICNFKFNKWVSLMAMNMYAHHFIAISEDESIDYNKHKTTVVFNSIDFKEIDGALSCKISLPLDKIHIGWIGRFSRSKGAWDFLNVATALNIKYENIHFHLLAPFPEEDAIEIINGDKLFIKQHLENLIKKGKLTHNLTLHGYRNDFLSVVASMDIMINCNRLGAFGRQAFETLCLGIPSVVTTKFPGKSTLLNNEVSSIVEEGNVNSIIEAVIKLINDESLRQNMSKKARIWAQERFNSSCQSQKILNLYKSILS